MKSFPLRLLLAASATIGFLSARAESLLGSSLVGGRAHLLQFGEAIKDRYDRLLNEIGNRKVVIEKAPRFGMVGQEQIVSFRIEEANGPGQPVEIGIDVGGGAPETYTVTPGQTVEIAVAIGEAESDG